jgi:hypothetical protein
MVISRVVACFLIFSLLVAFPGGNAAHGSEMILSMQKKSNGILRLKVDECSYKRTQIGVYSEEGESVYYFPYFMDDGVIDIPLMFGNGGYTISLFEEIGNNYYDTVESFSFELNLADYEEVYLSSSLVVPWDGAERTIAKARELTEGKRSDFEKFAAIYLYVTENIRYDISKETEIGYRSSPDATLEDGSGICLDLAVLFAALMRASGVKCKLVYGYAYGTDELHSWNEILVKGKWIVVDPTMDSHCFVSRIPYAYSKSADDYEGVNTF